MKDFNLAKYLKENYQGPFSMFQPYVDLNPLKEESEEQLDTEVPYKGPEPHLDGMGSDFEQAEPVEEGNLSEDATMRFDMSDPESSEDALEWILDNISDTEDVVKSEEEAMAFRQAPIEDIVDVINSRLQNSTIDIVGNSVIDELSQEFQEWVIKNNLPQFSADELLYDDSIEKTPEQEKYLRDFLNRWDSADDFIKLSIRNTPQIKEEVGAEQEKFDRMMGLIDRTLEAQLPKIKRAVDKAREMMISDKSIFNMLSTNSLTQQSVKDLVDDGFDKQDIVDFFATDFTIAEDGDNVTAADNAVYGADQEVGEPVEEEVTVSSSGVEMQEQEIDVFNSLGDKFEALRDEMSQIYAAASETNNKEWMTVLNVAAKHLDKLEGTLATASAKLGVLPKK
jgi:hypothetical protein